jgi:hypothetical protein
MVQWLRLLPQQRVVPYQVFVEDAVLDQQEQQEQQEQQIEEDVVLDQQEKQIEEV